MTTILKASDTAHFLSLIPAMLGFHPQASLVLVPFARSRSVGAMRIDLPSDAEAEQVAATCVGMMCRLPDADAVSAIVYTDRPYADARPYAELISAIELRAEACGLTIREALCVAADGWGSYLDPQCPPHGRDLAELEVDERFAVAADQFAGTELPGVTTEDRDAVEAALDALDGALDLICGRESLAGSARLDPRSLGAVCRLDDLPALFEEALGRDPDGLDASTAALLIWALSRPSSRDVALVQWCGDQQTGDEAVRAQLAWENGAAYPPELGERMLGEGPRPSGERLQCALDLSRMLAALAPDDRRAGAVACCGWLSWALGRSTHAEAYAQEACRFDPEHGLSEIVLSLVEIGRLPEWAFAPVPEEDAFDIGPDTGLPLI